MSAYTIHDFTGPVVARHATLDAAATALQRGQCVVHEGSVVLWHHDHRADDYRLAVAWLIRARVLPRGSAVVRTCVHPSGCTASVPPRAKVDDGLCALHRHRVQQQRRDAVRRAPVTRPAPVYEAPASTRTPERDAAMRGAIARLVEGDAGSARWAVQS